MEDRELYEMDGAAWLAAPVGEDAQPSEPDRPESLVQLIERFGIEVR